MNDITTTSWPVPGVPAARSRGGLPQQSVRATGRLDGLLFELSVEQRYRNESDRVIEAVFTFPVPVRSVLLGLELELGGRKLEAVAIAKAAATETYERAIDDGDAAVLLESVGNGLYTVSVGNLKPGESAVIRYRHSELLDANRGLLRLQVPTVIAPRYGNPASAGLEGPAVPEADLVAEYPFELEILLAGIQDDTSLESPTHSIRTQRNEAGTTVRLAKAATLDRDFVLEVPQANVPKNALVAQDGDEWVVVASAVLEGLAESERRALALTVLLDCSGSMQGDSIEAAKRAVGRVVENLGPEDRLGLLRFGSEFQWVTEGVAPCSRSTLTALKSAVRGIDADLGGTEMRAALEEAMRHRLPGGEEGGDLLMITDGQVHELDALVGLVAKAGRRLFVVAVGSAPNEALARKLSESTGGACEFVASGELAEDAIVRMFRRMRALPRRVGKVQWPEAVAWRLPAPRAVFPDETVHLVAGLKSMPVGRVRIAVGEASDAGGVRVIEVPVLATSIPAEVASTIVRVAGARRVAMLAEKDETTAAAALAERLQIASAFTSFVVVAERSAEEKAKGLPATVAVPQMLAAGFGGAGVVRALRSPACKDALPMSQPLLRAKASIVQPLRSPASFDSFDLSHSAADTTSEGLALEDEDLGLDLADLVPANESDAANATDGGSPKIPLDGEAARDLLALLARNGAPIIALRDLRRLGVPAVVLGVLEAIQRETSCSERALVDGLIELLVQQVGTDSAEALAVQKVWKPKRSLFRGRAARQLRRALQVGLFGAQP